MPWASALSFTAHRGSTDSLLALASEWLQLLPTVLCPHRCFPWTVSLLPSLLLFTFFSRKPPERPSENAALLSEAFGSFPLHSVKSKVLPGPAVLCPYGLPCWALPFCSVLATLVLSLSLTYQVHVGSFALAAAGLNPSPVRLYASLSNILQGFTRYPVLGAAFWGHSLKGISTCFKIPSYQRSASDLHHVSFISSLFVSTLLECRLPEARAIVCFVHCSILNA